MIKQTKDTYKVVSESGKNLGKYKSRAEAEKRLTQIEYFKHKKKCGICGGKYNQILGEYEHTEWCPCE